MSVKRITPVGFSVGITYDEDKAMMTVSSENTVAQYDEDEVDSMLRVVEYGSDAAEDLAELFQPEFPRTAYRIAVQIVDRANQLAECVYGEIR